MANRNTITCVLTGTPELERRLRLLEERLRLKIVRAALRKAAKPIIDAAKRNAKTTDARMGERLGGLSDSMGSVVRNYQKKVICVVGSLHGKVYQRKGKKELPAKIAHLVEFGHRIVVGGTAAPIQPEGYIPGKLVWNTQLRTLVGNVPGSRRTARSKRTGKSGQGKTAGTVRGQPFLRPAWDSQRSAAQSTLEQEIAAGIEREAAQ